MRIALWTYITVKTTEVVIYFQQLTYYAFCIVQINQYNYQAPYIMRVSRDTELNQSTNSNHHQKERLPNPAVYESLKTYQQLKNQLHKYFFEGIPLNIDNKAVAESYSAPYNLINSSQSNHHGHFQNMQQTFFDIYKKDLMEFAEKINQRLYCSLCLKADESIAVIAKWINTYTRFNHWIFRTFMFIERNFMRAESCKLYYEGIKILKKEVMDKNYNEIYKNILLCLEMYKEGQLSEYEPLQMVIKYIGIMGFTKFKLVDMIKIDNNFQYCSSQRGAEQQPENPYDTATFKRDFIARLVKDIDEKYTNIANEMSQLSTSEYFQKAIKYIEAEEKTADYFYGFKNSKDIVIRNVLEILVVARADGLLKNGKSGITKMMKQRNINNMKMIFSILRKANMTRVFYREFQYYVQAQGEAILNKISIEDERAMKKQTVTAVIGEIIQFNELIEKTRAEIDNGDNDLQNAQSVGFQGFCNTSSKVCNYLAYYADLMLKKDEAGSSSEELISQIDKITKYLYSYDCFMKMHQKLLGLRILYDNFKNQEAEFALIGMLKNEGDFNATSKLTNMISDMKCSQSWNIEFQLKNKFGFGFDVMMLTSGSWQINDPKCGRSQVPPQLMKAVQQYEQKFIQKMPNRTISWIFTHGRGIVQLINNKGAKYILVLNNYQLITLLHIQNNQYKTVKYGDLVDDLKIEDEPFYKNSIMNLLKYGVLVRAGNSVKIQSKSDELSFNFDFKYKAQKVGCIVIPKYTDKAANIGSEVTAERCILIDAALVKIMKQRRKASYNDVIAQVQKMCKTFKAQVAQIKLRIQNCQQRQFLQRDASDMNILVYKP